MDVLTVNSSFHLNCLRWKCHHSEIFQWYIIYLFKTIDGLRMVKCDIILPYWTHSDPMLSCPCLHSLTANIQLRRCWAPSVRPKTRDATRSLLQTALHFPRSKVVGQLELPTAATSSILESTMKCRSMRFHWRKSLSEDMFSFLRHNVCSSKVFHSIQLNILI